MSGRSSGLDARLVVDRGDGFRLAIDLDIPAGTTVALLGPNGAGKSSTVAALAGLIPLDDGHVTIDGRTVEDPNRGVLVPAEARGFGVVFQDYLLFDHLNVLDNVMFGPLAAGAKRGVARASAIKWLDRLDLTPLAQRRPSQLSGGQAHRVALARALVVEPCLLLLDEPLAALDIGTRGELRRSLARHLSDFVGPRLLITHDPTDAFLLADQIYILEDGTISQRGTADDIRRRPATPYAAALAGTNLLIGENAGGRLTLRDRTEVLQTSDTTTTGPVLITIHPNAIALHAEQPHGSPRNSWQTTVASVEPLGDTTRVTLGDPLALGVDITAASTVALGLAPGTRVWASVKATEVIVAPAAT